MTGLVHSQATLLHDTGAGHPERPGRIGAVLDRLRRDGLAERCLEIEPRPATDEDLLRVHAPGYLATVRGDVERGERTL